MDRPRFPLDKMFLVIFTLFNTGALTALFFPSWHRLLLFLTVWITVAVFGIGVCYHRLLTHRGFVVPKWLEYTLAIIAHVGLQGLAIVWVAIHRIHHLYTEMKWNHDPSKPLHHDPHTPRDGSWWAHMDWLLHPDPVLHNMEYLNKWVPDLLRQKFYRQKYLLWLPTTTLGLVTLYFGGWKDMLWSTFLPVSVLWQCTWLVNSGSHLWGSRRFNTKDDSRNNWFIAFFTGGEGWHNNHHFYPPSAQHGIAWYEIDVNWRVVQFLHLIGLAKKVIPFKK